MCLLLHMTGAGNGAAQPLGVDTGRHLPKTVKHL